MIIFVILIREARVMGRFVVHLATAYFKIHMSRVTTKPT
jgi:hypothetical protein